MQKTKQITTLLLTVTMLCGGLTACGKNSGGGVSMVDRPAGQEKEETKIVEEELTEAEVAQESSSTVEEEKKINYTRFEDLSLAAERVGFSFRAAEETTENFYFSSFSIKEQQDEDEEGNKIGDSYPMVVLMYRQVANKFEGFTVSIYPVQNGREPRSSYVTVGEEEMEGVKISLTDYVLKLVLPDYELTEEDWEFVNSGKGSFSSDGATEGETHNRGAYWIEKQIYYEAKGWKPDIPEDELLEIVQATLTAEYK